MREHTKLRTFELVDEIVETEKVLGALLRSMRKKLIAFSLQPKQPE